MERKNNILNKIFSPKLLIIEWSFIVLFCFFIGCSIRSLAASQTSTEIPYNVAEMSSYNEMMLSRLDLALSQYRSGHNIDESVPLLVWTQDGFYNGNFWQYYIMREPYLRDGYNYQSGYDFSSNVIWFSSQYQIESISIMNNGSIGGWSINLGLNANLCGNAQSIQTTEGYYLPRYPFYYNGEPLIDSVYNTEVLISRVNGQAPSGSATQPDLTGDNIGSDKPDIDDYVPTQPTAPTFDNSSLESMVESLYNWLKWEYNAITSTLKGLINYVGDTITYSIQKVIDNIKNAIQNFYDNMKSLFEPLLNGMAEIAQGIKSAIENIGALLEAFFAPFDEEQFQEAYNNCQFISAVDGFKDSIEEFEHAFTYAEERDYYTLYLGFIMDGYTVNYDLDFTWLYPLRQYYRPIIWCVVVYEFFVYLCAQLSDYLQGRSGK